MYVRVVFELSICTPVILRVCVFVAQQLLSALPVVSDGLQLLQQACLSKRARVPVM